MNDQDGPNRVPRFTAPTIPEAARQAARRVFDEYCRAAAGGGSGPTMAAIVDEHEHARLARMGMGTCMAFCFPSNTYNNTDAQGRGLEEAIGLCCVRIFSATDRGVEVYLEELLEGALEDVNLEYIDGVCQGFRDRDRTVRECIQALLNLGMTYIRADPETGERCLFEASMAAAVLGQHLDDALEVPPGPNRRPGPKVRL